MQTIITFFIIVATIFVYYLMNLLYFKYRWNFLIPLLTASIVIILTLVIFKVPYETYMIGGKWIDLLLGPAVVSLAIPLYKQRELLKRHLIPILSGTLIGAFLGIISGLFFAKMFGFSKELILTLLPKSITSPVAIQIATGLGGIPTLAPIFVMIAGFSGVIFGPSIFKWFKIDTPLGRGIGLGAAAHAIGTAKAIEYGEQETSMSSVAMTLCAIMGSLIGPLIVWLIFL